MTCPCLQEGGSCKQRLDPSGCGGASGLEEGCDIPHLLCECKHTATHICHWVCTHTRTPMVGPYLHMVHTQVDSHSLFWWHRVMFVCTHAHTHVRIQSGTCIWKSNQGCTHVRFQRSESALRLIVTVREDNSMISAACYRPEVSGPRLKSGLVRTVVRLFEYVNFDKDDENYVRNSTRSSVYRLTDWAVLHSTGKTRKGLLVNAGVQNQVTVTLFARKHVC